MAPRVDGDSLTQHLLRTLDSHAYLMRLRAVYLVLASLTLVWVYLLVLQRGGKWLEALLAASLVACSWEVAYHVRWVATDGMLMQFAGLTVLLAAQALKSPRQSWLFAAAAVAGVGWDQIPWRTASGSRRSGRVVWSKRVYSRGKGESSCQSRRDFWADLSGSHASYHSSAKEVCACRIF